MEIFTPSVLYFYQLYMSAMRLVSDSVSFALFVDIWVIDAGFILEMNRTSHRELRPKSHFCESR